MLCFGYNLVAQDRIVTKEGNILDVYNVEIASNYVFYSEQNSADADILKISKDEILMIRFQDGSKKIFAGGNGQETVKEEKKTEAENENVVKDYSIPAEEYEMLKDKYRVPVSYVGEPSSKDAKSFYCQFDFCKGAVLADKNIEIELATVCRQADNTGNTNAFVGSLSEELMNALDVSLSVTLKNKTDRIIYVDLANSFFVRGDEASPYYVPTSTSVTGTSGNAVGINLGGITNALGIGGMVGSIANATSVGGGSSTSSTTVTYSQRFVSIPPKSSFTLDPQLIFLPGKELYDLDISQCLESEKFGVYVYLKSLGLKRGEEMNWDEDSSPVMVRTFINYSLDSEFKNIGQISTSLYAKKMIGVPKMSGGFSYSTIDVSYLSENFAESLFFTGEFSKR